MQAQNLVSILKSADIAFEEANYYGAARLYQDALKHNTRMYDIHFKAAESFRLDNDYVRAIKHYKKVADKASDKFPISIFHLAEMQKSDEDYFSAQFNFNKYYEQHAKDSNNYYTSKAKQEIINCEKAIKIKYNPTGVFIQHCDTSINSLYSEFGCSVLSDSIIFFSSIKPIDNDSSYVSHIYYSRYENDKWNSAKIFDTIINQRRFHTSNPCYVPELNSMFFSAKPTDKDEKSHVYRTLWKDGKWLGPFKLPLPINSNEYNSIQPNVSAYKDGYIMFYTCDNTAGIGAYDIWYVLMDNKFRFKSPHLAGIPPDIDSIYIAYFGVESVVNSAGNEITPFFNAQDSSLYFSSDWHSGMGGYDIFSTHTDLTEWSNPANIGYPTNTSQNDLYYTITNKGDKAYLTSNRKEALALKHQSCCNDLFFHEIPQTIDSNAIVKQQIVSLTYEATQLVPITLYFHNDEPNPNCWDTITQMNYTTTWVEYTKRISEYNDVFSHGLSSKDKIAANDSIDDFFSNSVTKEYQKLLKFATLLEELVKKDQQIIITIKGYTSPLNTSEYNENLAKRRISSLMNFFRSYKNGFFNEYELNGIIKYEQVGFGETLANSQVSDDPLDKRNSVYNPLAARERKIRIIAVSVVKHIE